MTLRTRLTAAILAALLGPILFGAVLTVALAVDARPAAYVYAILAGLVVVAGFVAVAGARRLARATTRPLVELSEAVERLAAGELTAEVPVRGRDEIGRLADQLNRMAQEMRGYARALEVSRDQLRANLGVLGATLSSTHDLPRMMEVILRSAVTATGAAAGVVLLADPETGQLVAACGEGLGERVGDPAYAREFSTGQLRLPTGQGLLGTVAATDTALRGRVDRDGPELHAAEPRCHTYVAVPLVAGEKPATDRHGPHVGSSSTAGCHGVLALYDRHGQDDFDDADLATLKTFAAQAAVAVDNVHVHEEARRLSLTDPLTGLWNYRYLRESVRREVERASRFGRNLCVLAMDLDRFKEINDNYGHAAGDAVLVEFARRIQAETREVDLVFRHGGEEFVVLLPETDARGGTIVAQRLGSAIRDVAMQVQGHAPGLLTDGRPLTINVTVSIGIAVFPLHAATEDLVLAAADEALYAAKAAGRATYRLAAAGGTPTRPFFVAAQPNPSADHLPRLPAGCPSAGHPTPPIDANATVAARLGSVGGASVGTRPPRQTRGQ